VFIEFEFIYLLSFNSVRKEKPKESKREEQERRPAKKV
jgi:hypothetical protein